MFLLATIFDDNNSIADWYIVGDIGGLYGRLLCFPCVCYLFKCGIAVLVLNFCKIFIVRKIVITGIADFIAYGVDVV